MDKDKTQAILKIFLRYPSLMSLPVSEKQGMVAAYLDDCSSVTADEILEGFARFRQLGSPYPPSGPELLKAARNIRADKIAKERASQPKLPSKPRGLSAVPESERAANIMRINAILAGWRTKEATK